MILYLIAIIYGLMMGNYMTTVFHRIPAGLPINGINEKIGSKPHCDACGHKLKPHEYLPVISWFATLFKCNYCGAPIPKIYAIIEALTMLSSIVLLKTFGMNLTYVIAVPIAALVILNFAFLIKLHKVYNKVLLFTIAVFALSLVIKDYIG